MPKLRFEPVLYTALAVISVCVAIATARLTGGGADAAPSPGLAQSTASPGELAAPAPKSAPPPVALRRSASGAHSQVWGALPQKELQRYASRVDRAAIDVARVWGDKTPQVSFIVVDDVDEMAALLGGPRDDLVDRAAVTVPTASVRGWRPTGVAAKPSSDTVIIADASALAKLNSAGRRVVFTHEVAHVISNSATPLGFPVWLSEGFADYVAVKAARVAPSVVVPDALEKAAAGKVNPTPPDAQFAESSVVADLAYQNALLTVVDVERRYGERKLVEWYRAVGLDVSMGNATPMALKLATERTLGVAYDRLISDAKQAARTRAARSK